jgi:Zn-dependent protease
VDFDIRELVLRLPVVLFSLTIHEFMHAWTAWKCGDDTAYRQGRVSLNPLVHLDLVGTLCLIFAPIGWAKPVPVNPYNYGRPRRDDILVSGAGVAANLTVAVVFSLLLRFFPWGSGLLSDEVATIVFLLLLQLALVNFGLFVFNLLPIPPLDGSHILRELLPAQAAAQFSQISRYGVIVLVVAVVASRNIQFSFMRYPHVSPLHVPVILLMQVFAGPELTEAVFGG